MSPGSTLRVRADELQDEWARRGLSLAEQRAELDRLAAAGQELAEVIEILKNRLHCDDLDAGIAPFQIEPGDCFGTGKVIEVLKRLGAGGMGEVFEAQVELRDGGTPVIRRVALKVCTYRPGTDAVELAEQDEQFRKEMNNLAKLPAHRDIVTIFTFDWLEKIVNERPRRVLCFAMELHAGACDLDTWVRTQHLREAPSEILGLIIQVCDALDSAHQVRVSHGDISPRNVLVRRDGNALLIDFGLARLAGSIGTGLFGGAPGYMAPELPTTGATSATDIFSLGVLLLRALTHGDPVSLGKAPPEDAAAAVIAHLSRNIAATADRWRDDLVRIIRRCTAPNPGDRYATAKKLAVDLGKLQRNWHRSDDRSIGSNAIGTAPDQQDRLRRLLNPLSFDAELADEKRFVGRKWLTLQLEQWMAGPQVNPISLIVGPPGIGKTAYCAWLARHRSDVVAVHFCSSGHTEKASPERCVLSLAYQLATKLTDLRDTLEALPLERLVADNSAAALFDGLIVQPLSQAVFPVPDKPLLVIVDALDETTEKGRNELAEVLAAQLHRIPKWLRFLLTSRDDPSVTHPLQALRPVPLVQSAEENTNDMREWISQAFISLNEGKPLSPAVLETILLHSEGLFLYVELLRREIESGNQTMSEIGEIPKGWGGILARFFRRQFPDLTAYGRDFRPVFEVLAASSSPVPLDTLASLFSWTTYQRRDIVTAVRGMFPARRGCLYPFHHAVLEWLTDPECAGLYFADESEGHARLGDSCLRQLTAGVAVMSEYAKSNICLHLSSVERWDDLKGVLCNLEFLVTWNAPAHAVMLYWARIEAHSDHSLIESFRGLIGNPLQHPGAAARIQAYLLHAGHTTEALQISSALIEHFRRTNDLHHLMAGQQTRSVLLSDIGRNEEALACIEEAAALARQLNDQAFLSTCLGGLAGAHLARSDFDEAWALLVEQERLCTELGFIAGLPVCLFNQGTTLASRGELSKAWELAERVEALAMILCDMVALQYALRLKGDVAHRSGDRDASRSFLHSAEDVCRGISLNRHLVHLLEQKAERALERNDLDEASKAFQETERLSRQMGAVKTLMGSLCGQAEVKQRQLDWEAAWEFYSKAQDIAESHDVGLACLEVFNGCISIAKQQGRQDRRREALQRLETASGKVRDGFVSGILKGMVCGMKGRHKEAAEHFAKTVESIKKAGQRKRSDEPLLIEALHHHANALWDSGDRPNAERIWQEWHTLAQKAKDQAQFYRHGLVRAMALNDVRDSRQGLPLLLELERIGRELSKALPDFHYRSLMACARQECDFHEKRNELQEALTILSQMERLARDRDPRGLPFILVRKAKWCGRLRRLQDALDATREAEKLAIEYDDKHSEFWAIAFQVDALWSMHSDIGQIGELHTRSRVLAETIGGGDVNVKIIEQQAYIALREDQDDEALRLFRRMEREASGDMAIEARAMSYIDQVQLLAKLKGTSEAREVAQRAIRDCGKKILLQMIPQDSFLLQRMFELAELLIETRVIG